MNFKEKMSKRHSKQYDNYIDETFKAELFLIIVNGTKYRIPKSYLARPIVLESALANIVMSFPGKNDKIEIEVDSFDLSIDANENATILNLSIPVLRPKTDEEIDEALSIQEKVKIEKTQEIVGELQELVKEKAQELAEQLTDDDKKPSKKEAKEAQEEEVKEEKEDEATKEDEEE